MRKWMLALAVVMIMSIATIASAESGTFYYPKKEIFLQPTQQVIEPMLCNGTDHSSRSGAYYLKADGVTPMPFNNPVLQQVPEWDAGKDNIVGMQFGIQNQRPAPKHIVIWLECQRAPGSSPGTPVP